MREFIRTLTSPLCVTEVDFWSKSLMLEEAVYEFERRFTKFVEIMQNKSHYAVQGYSR